MSIKEVENKLNISRANIRFYEKEGLLEPKRNNNEYRNYSEEDIKRLEQILLFRKCNISIENIRLIFNGRKNIDEVFKEQISLIENELKELEGAKIICKKLTTVTSIDNLDANKYINLIKTEEEKGNKFYNITKDYILANENLYQSIIENREFKGEKMMKKGIKIGIYITSFLATILLFAIFDYIIFNNIDWADIICFTSILTVANIIGVKKYIEQKSGKKFTRKDNINHFIIVITMMIFSLFGYLIIKTNLEINKDPNSNVLEMSLKQTLIDISNKKYSNNNYIKAESHKIIDTEVKHDKIYVYLIAYYATLSKDNCEVVDNMKDTLTIIYKNNKNKNGVYELLEYKENYLPNKLKNKVNINNNASNLEKQLKNYCNN